jgi:hypothetical protein
MRARLSFMDQDNVQQLIQKWKDEKGSTNDFFFSAHTLKEVVNFGIRNYPMKKTATTMLL